LRIGFTAGALGAFKAALAGLGVFAHADTWPPLLPLTDEEKAQVMALVTASVKAA
jgi:4-hydroxy-tetrahydrodipicolinate synthase